MEVQHDPRRVRLPRAESLEEVIRELQENGDEAKLLAGGHSLLPLMKLRLAAPALLVDLRKVPGLHGVEKQDGHWRIGALTPHAFLERTPELGIVSEVAATIADPQVRNRGTIGGSLAPVTPRSDLPAAMLITEAEVTLQGPNGQRSVAAADLCQDYLEADVGPEEVMTEIRTNTLDGWGHAYQKFNRRSEDWAMVAVCAVVERLGRRLPGRTRGVDQYGLDAAAGDGGRGRPARAGAQRREHRQGGRARGRGHRAPG